LVVDPAEEVCTVSIQTRVSRTVEAPTSHRRRVVLATIAAQSIEFYDFLIYGTAASLVLNAQFFPSVDPVVGTLASFATFAVGFFGRPVGAAVFGHFGDRYGRKPALLAAMLLMAVSTLLIGLLPNYAVIGVAAPALLAFLRVLQGFSVGGQWGGTTLLSVEQAPPNRRGLYGALPQLGVFLGLASGTLVFLVVSNLTSAEQFAAWGWRIPFLLTVVMFPVAWFVHRYVEDSPQFRDAEVRRATQSRGGEPPALLQLLRRPRQMLLVAFTFLPATISFYIIVTGLLNYGVHTLGISSNTMLTVVLLAMVAYSASGTGLAALSDRIGRRKIFAAGAVLTGVWSFALFPLVETRSFPLMLLGAAVGLIGVGAMFGPSGAMFAEMFPPAVRYSGASLGNQLSNILGGGLAPFVMVALLAGTHTTVSVSIYVTVASAISLVALSMIKIDRGTGRAGVTAR
jgi:MFS family permease